MADIEEKKPETQLQAVQSEISSFANKDAFDHIQRVAKMFSGSDMVPDKYKNNIGNCVIALEMANRMGVNPLTVMQNLDVIKGQPCWSSKFLIASLNACGRFSPIRYEDVKEDDGRVRAWANDKETGERLNGVWVSMKMAKAEGWVSKTGSKWQTMPELMMRYRAASFFTKQYAPEISMGFQSREEVEDITSPVHEVVRENKELERLTLMIADCKTEEELVNLYEQTPSDLTEKTKDLFESKKAALKGKLL